MNLSNDIKAVGAVYFDTDSETRVGYAYSYRSRTGDVLHVFSDKVMIEGTKTVIYFKDVETVDLEGVRLKRSEDCSVGFRGSFGSISVPVDTMTGKYLDVFTIQRDLRRRVAMFKSV